MQEEMAAGATVLEGGQLKITPKLRKALESVADFTLVDALYGRRSRRFCLGASIPDGPLAYKSRHNPMPLNLVEQILLLTSTAGITGWHYAITRHARYAPRFPNYSGSAGGRVFPSSAGFHTSEIFFTDDEGTYFFPTRDMHPSPPDVNAEELDLEAWMSSHYKRIKKLSNKRIYLPSMEPYMEGHNTWIANHPGSTLIIPVGDVAQHNLANICFFTQNGYCIYDDIAKKKIPGIEKYATVVDVDHPIPLTFVEQYSLTECTAELSTACFAGVLMLQAMGLGGWMFDGIDRLTMLGASGNPEVPGLGFRYDKDPRWALPNPTGLPGVFEGFCPPHFRDMREALEALEKRKFGRGGVYNPETPGAWKDSRLVRGSAQPFTEPFKECVALQAQYVYDTYGKFPATVPTVYIMTYVQGQHLDVEFYDTHFKPGAYLKTHAEHMSLWH
jgi:hypothetical protein